MLQKLSFRRSAWLPAIALVSGLAMTSSAVAEIITKWDYTIQSLFTAWAPGSVTAFDAGDGPSTGLEWGDGPKSSLVIDTGSFGEIETYIGGGAVPIAWAEDGDTITHHNNPITGSSLTSATVQSTLTLTPNTPPALGLPSISPLQINIAFAETPNVQGTCASAGSPVPCNDIFVLTGGLLNSGFTFDSGDGVNQQYYVNVFPIAGTQLSLLSAAECSAAGVLSGCIGFSTVEEKSNLVQFGFTISTERLTVPEPAVLALFGLGLIGMGAMRRQKHTA